MSYSYHPIIKHYISHLLDAQFFKSPGYKKSLSNPFEHLLQYFLKPYIFHCYPLRTFHYVSYPQKAWNLSVMASPVEVETSPSTRKPSNNQELLRDSHFDIYDNVLSMGKLHMISKEDKYLAK